MIIIFSNQALQDFYTSGTYEKPLSDQEIKQWFLILTIVRSLDHVDQLNYFTFIQHNEDIDDLYINLSDRVKMQVTYKEENLFQVKDLVFNEQST